MMNRILLVISGNFCNYSICSSFPRVKQNSQKVEDAAGAADFPHPDMPAANDNSLIRK